MKPEARIDVATVRRLTLRSPGWHVVELPVAKPVASYVLVEVRVGYTFVPAALGIGADSRRLGVRVRTLGWTGSALPARRP